MFFRSMAAVAALTLGSFAALPSQGSTLGIDAAGAIGFCVGCTPEGSTLGWSFNLLVESKVPSLGAWVPDAGGLVSDAKVGLWDNSGTLLTSTVIDNMSTFVASAGTGGWLFEDVAAITLQPGIYTVGMEFFDSDNAVLVGTYGETNARLNYIGGVSNNGQGLAFPTNVPNPNVGNFGANLTLTQLPVPASVVLLGAAVGGLGATRRLRRT